MLIDDTFSLIKPLELGSAKTQNILHELLLSRVGNGESFKWKLLYPRYSVFFSVNGLGLSANEVVP